MQLSKHYQDTYGDKWWRRRKCVNSEIQKVGLFYISTRPFLAPVTLLEDLEMFGDKDKMDEKLACYKLVHQNVWLPWIGVPETRELPFGVFCARSRLSTVLVWPASIRSWASLSHWPQILVYLLAPCSNKCTWSESSYAFKVNSICLTLAALIHLLDNDRREDKRCSKVWCHCWLSLDEDESPNMPLIVLDMKRFVLFAINLGARF